MSRGHFDTPIFIVTLKRGMADNHRLPLNHVIDLLKELDLLIREVGKAIQRDNGVAQPTGDFGIQLLATSAGVVFRKGSIRATAAITQDIPNGRRTVQQIISTAAALEKKRPVSVEDEAGTHIVRRFGKIGLIQKEDHTQLTLELRNPGLKKKPKAVFGQAGIATVEAIEGRSFNVEEMTLFGRLRELRDRSKDETTTKHFWGELLLDNDHVWHLRFPASDAEDVIKLFRRQVEVHGTATYFAARHPRLAVSHIVEDRERDYLQAFDDLQGSDRDLYGSEKLEDLMREARGG
jgi:hypothetical protein